MGMFVALGPGVCPSDYPAAPCAVNRYCCKCSAYLLIPWTWTWTAPVQRIVMVDAVAGPAPSACPAAAAALPRWPSIWHASAPHPPPVSRQEAHSSSRSFESTGRCKLGKHSELASPAILMSQTTAALHICRCNASSRSIALCSAPLRSRRPLSALCKPYTACAGEGACHAVSPPDDGAQPLAAALYPRHCTEVTAQPE